MSHKEWLRSINRRTKCRTYSAFMVARGASDLMIMLGLIERGLDRRTAKREVRRARILHKIRSIRRKL